MPLPIIPNNRQRSPHTRTTHPFCSEVAHSEPAPDVPHTGEEAPVLEPWEYNTGTPTHDHSDRHTRRRTSPAACLPPAHGRAAAPAACLVSSRTPSRLCADHTARLALKTGRQGQAILSTKGRYLHGDSRCLLSRPLRPLRRAPKQGRTGHITLVVAPLEQRLYIHPTSSRRAGINHCIPQPEGHTVKLVPGQCLLGLTQVLLRLILLDKRLHHTGQQPPGRERRLLGRYHRQPGVQHRQERPIRRSSLFHHTSSCHLDTSFDTSLHTTNSPFTQAVFTTSHHSRTHPHCHHCPLTHPASSTGRMRQSHQVPPAPHKDAPETRPWPHTAQDRLAHTERPGEPVPTAHSPPQAQRRDHHWQASTGDARPAMPPGHTAGTAAAAPWEEVVDRSHRKSPAGAGTAHPSDARAVSLAAPATGH